MKKKRNWWGGVGKNSKLVFFTEYNKPKTGSNYSEAKVILYMKNIKIKVYNSNSNDCYAILPLGTHVSLKKKKKKNFIMKLRVCRKPSIYFLGLKVEISSIIS